MLDQKPVVTLALGGVAAYSHQDPTALETLTIELEFEVPSAQCRLGRARAFTLPIAAVPHLDGAAAILSFGDRPFEIAIVEWMILYLDGEPLVVPIERWPLRH